MTAHRGVSLYEYITSTLKPSSTSKGFQTPPSCFAPLISDHILINIFIPRRASSVRRLFLMQRRNLIISLRKLQSRPFSRVPDDIAESLRSRYGKGCLQTRIRPDRAVERTHSLYYTPRALPETPWCPDWVRDAIREHMLHILDPGGFSELRRMQRGSCASGRRGGEDTKIRGAL